MSESKTLTPDSWSSLARFTPARIGLGRCGASLPTHEVLKFGLAHARARDAVRTPLDGDGLEAKVGTLGLAIIRVNSAAAARNIYLARPDLGRRLSATSEEHLRQLNQSPVDICLVIADGLSSAAAQSHGPPLLRAFLEEANWRWSVGPIVIAEQARVALGDALGESLRARLVAVLIGERPGLSSPDSLGVYITFNPRVGRTDAERNCISNIRPEGLDYVTAAKKMVWLIAEAFRLGLTGVKLKDASQESVAHDQPALIEAHKNRAAC